MTPLSHNRIIVPTSLRNRLLQRRLGRPVGGRAPQRDGGIGAAFERRRYMSLGRFDCGERQTSIGQGIRPAEHAGVDRRRQTGCESFALRDRGSVLQSQIRHS